jgi:hypothetical protein
MELATMLVVVKVCCCERMDLCLSLAPGEVVVGTMVAWRRVMSVGEVLGSSREWRWGVRFARMGLSFEFHSAVAAVD